MILSTLIKKGGLSDLATATTATLATERAESPLSVADVATVAVTVPLKPVAELPAEDESKIRAWLAHIGERDPRAIEEVTEQCRSDLPYRHYLLARADDIPRRFEFPRIVTCGACCHFKRIEHPHLGHCTRGKPEAPAGLWGEDERTCECFTPLLKVIGDTE
jgi:hypothetical protein